MLKTDEEAKAITDAKLASGEWVEMYRYYSPIYHNWTIVFGTPEQKAELDATREKCAVLLAKEKT